MDLMLDRYSFSFNNFPARIGMEATGIVDEIGEGVTGIELGTRYCTLPYFYFNKGASADFVTIDARYVTPAPKNLSAVESASVWMQFMTAYYPIVELCKAAPGKHILATAATSTAGNAALNIGAIFGANMIATTRFEENRDYLLESGASHVIVSGNNELAATLRQMTDGHGIDAAFDPVGAGMIAQYSSALARDATIFFMALWTEFFLNCPLLICFRQMLPFILIRCLTMWKILRCRPRELPLSTMRLKMENSRRISTASIRWKSIERLGNISASRALSMVKS
jgi:NADPH:quinone reductase-like Zn-dependent oxidoreductase